MPQITSVRADEISLLIGSWIKAGNSAVGVTLTPRHDFSMRLGPLFGAVSEAFSWILNGRPWRRIKAELGIVGTIRVIEITCGCNGWHPHVHAIFVVEGDRAAEAAAALGVYAFSRWGDWLTGAGYPAPTWQHGIDVQVIHSGEAAGRYLAKLQDGRSLGNELARWDLKQGKNGHRTYFQLVRDFRLQGDEADLVLLREHQQATKSRRRIVFSLKLRAVMAETVPRGNDPDEDWLVSDPTDEEITGRSAGGTRVLSFSHESWRAITADRGLSSRIVVAYDVGGLDAVAALLDEFGHVIAPDDGGIPQVVPACLLCWHTGGHDHDGHG